MHVACTMKADSVTVVSSCHRHVRLCKFVRFCSDLLDFDHVTPDVPSRSSFIGQRHSSDRQIIALFQEIGVAECNGDVRLF